MALPATGIIARQVVISIIFRQRLLFSQNGDNFFQKSNIVTPFDDSLVIFFEGRLILNRQHSDAMYISVLLERIARGIMDKVSIKNDLELINSKFGTSYTASDYMYGKGHIKQIVTYISIGEESIAELISNPKLSDAKRTVILDLLSRGLTVDQIKPYIQSDDPYTAEQLQFELYKLFFTQIGIVNSRNITK